MSVVYSAHARDRMAERGIPERAVTLAVRWGSLYSRGDGWRCYQVDPPALRRHPRRRDLLDWRGLRVIVNRDGLVVTAYFDRPAAVYRVGADRGLRRVDGS